MSFHAPARTQPCKSISPRIHLLKNIEFLFISFIIPQANYLRAYSGVIYCLRFSKNRIKFLVTRWFEQMHLFWTVDMNQVFYLLVSYSGQ